ERRDRRGSRTAASLERGRGNRDVVAAGGRILTHVHMLAVDGDGGLTARRDRVGGDVKRHVSLSLTRGGGQNGNTVRVGRGGPRAFHFGGNRHLTCTTSCAHRAVGRGEHDLTLSGSRTRR